MVSREAMLSGLRNMEGRGEGGGGEASLLLFVDQFNGQRGRARRLPHAGTVFFGPTWCITDSTGHIEAY